MRGIIAKIIAKQQEVMKEYRWIAVYARNFITNK